MTFKKTALMLSACVVMAPSVAFAQDWGGLYGGLTLSGAAHNAAHSYSNLAPSGNSDPNGFLYGAFVGYAVDNGKVVWGGEIDFEGSNATGEFVNLTGATSGGRTDLNWQGSARLVIGVPGNLGSQPALYYFTAGYAHGDFDFYGGPSGGYLANMYSRGLDGWTAGIGMDVRMNAKTAWRVEYRYTDYGTTNGALAPTFPGVNMPVSVSQHALRAGLRMDF